MLYLFAIGAGLATVVQSACTSALMKSLQNPYVVVLISLGVSVAVACVVALLTDGFSVGRAASVPWWAWLAGACGALVLLSQPIAAHRLGAATFIGLFVSASVVTSVLMDQYGWLGFDVHRAGVWRIIGVALMVGGVTLVSVF